jgi:DNA-binding MarR family transcriptional regulator
MDPADSQDVQSLADALRPVVLRLWRQLRRESVKLHVSAPQVTLLIAINSRPGVGVKELAEVDQITPASASVHVKQLELQGLIARDPLAHTDRRRVGLVATKAGKELLNRLRQVRNDRLAREIAQLGAQDRAALSTAMDALRKLGAGLSDQ